MFRFVEDAVFKRCFSGVIDMDGCVLCIICGRMDELSWGSIWVPFTMVKEVDKGRSEMKHDAFGICLD